MTFIEPMREPSYPRMEQVISIYPGECQNSSHTVHCRAKIDDRAYEVQLDVSASPRVGDSICMMQRGCDGGPWILIQNGHITFLMVLRVNFLIDRYFLLSCHCSKFQDGFWREPRGLEVVYALRCLLRDP